MDSIGNERDIIIITGCNSVGKTTASNYLRREASSDHMPYEDKIVADSQCLFEVMQTDDQVGGLHHTHDWCITGTQGHSHDPDQPLFPFTVTDNELPNMMREQFFMKLANLQETGNLWFVEWAAGVNTNPPEDPASCIDYSYATVKRMLQDGSLPDSWLNRVKAVIHLEASYEVRLCLNAQRSIPTLAQPEAIEKGIAFWQKDERVLRFYGSDDFSEIAYLLETAGIPIYTIDNDGRWSFYEELESIAVKLFVPDLITATMD